MAEDPKKQDYLTTTTKMLQQLFDNTSHLDQKDLTTKSNIRWHQGNSALFDVCRMTSRYGYVRLQQLFPQSATGTFVPPTSMAKKAP
jgi:hypothetical protein